MGIFSTKRSNYQEWLWQKNKKSEHHIFRLLRPFLQILNAVIEDIKEGQLRLRAMSLVYTTVISLVPLFAISFSVLKGLGAHNKIKPMILGMLEPLGEKRFEIADKLLGFIDNIQVGILGALGVVILVYTVIGMMQKIEHAFNYVWHVSSHRSFGQRFSDYLSVLLVGPLFIVLSAGMTASLHSNYMMQWLDGIPLLNALPVLVGVVLPYLMLAGVFTFLYSFIPNTKVKIKAAFIGGLTTAFMWKAMGWGFSSFVANSANHTAIYSAFATIIVFMVWIYLVWLVLLIGASIGFYWQYPEYRKSRYNALSIGSVFKEASAVQIMIEVAKCFDRHQTPIASNDLSELCNQPRKVIDEIVDYLMMAGLLNQQDKTKALLPARPLEDISTYDIITAVRVHMGSTQTVLSKAAAKKYAKDVDVALSKAFKGETLKKHIR
jgi:membrane protein